MKKNESFLSTLGYRKDVMRKAVENGEFVPDDNMKKFLYDDTFGDGVLSAFDLDEPSVYEGFKGKDATEVVQDLYELFPDVQFYDERDMGDNVVLLFEITGHDISVDELKATLDEWGVKYSFKGSLLKVVAPEVKTYLNTDVDEGLSLKESEEGLGEQNFDRFMEEYPMALDTSTAQAGPEEGGWFYNLGDFTFETFFHFRDDGTVIVDGEEEGEDFGPIVFDSFDEFINDEEHGVKDELKFWFDESLNEDAGKITELSNNLGIDVDELKGRLEDLRAGEIEFYETDEDDYSDFANGLRNMSLDEFADWLEREVGKSAFISMLGESLTESENKLFDEIFELASDLKNGEIDKETYNSCIWRIKRRDGVDADLVDGVVNKVFDKLWPNESLRTKLFKKLNCYPDGSPMNESLGTENAKKIYTYVDAVDPYDVISTLDGNTVKLDYGGDDYELIQCADDGKITSTFFSNTVSGNGDTNRFDSLDDYIEMSGIEREDWDDIINNYYEESLTEGAMTNGSYSLYNGWVKVPNKDSIPDEYPDLEPEYSEWVKRAESLETIEDINNFIDDVYKLRQQGLLNSGEYGKENLIFKELRNNGYLQKAKDMKVEKQNQEMSLESLGEALSYEEAKKVLAKQGLELSRDTYDLILGLNKRPKDYTVTIGFGGFIGAEKEYDVYEATEDEAIDAALEEAYDDLGVTDIDVDDDGDYTVYVRFAGYIGADKDYYVSADDAEDSDEAERDAIENAQYDLEVISVVCDGEENESLKEDADSQYSKGDIDYQKYLKLKTSELYKSSDSFKGKVDAWVEKNASGKKVDDLSDDELKKLLDGIGYKKFSIKEQLTERHWILTIPGSYRTELEEAGDNEDIEAAREVIIKMCDYVIDHVDVFDDPDDIKYEYEDVKEDVEVASLDDLDDVDFYLDELYDLMDNTSVFLGIGESLKESEVIGKWDDKLEEHIKIDLGSTKNGEIISDVIGQLSDGIWENSPGVDKYWECADVDGSTLDVNVGLYDKLEYQNGRRDRRGYYHHRSMPSGFRGKSENQIRAYFANKLKQVVKIEQGDYPNENLSWDRNNNTSLNYLDCTVAEAYACYDFLRGRSGHGYNIDADESLKESKGLKEEFKLYMDIGDYKPWSGAVDTWDTIVKASMVDQLEFMLEDMYPEGMSDTELNDLLWFDGDEVLSWLGLSEEEDDDEDGYDESLKESYSKKDFGKFIEDSVNILQNSDYTNRRLVLDDDLCLYVGWSDADDEIAAKIAERNDYDWADFDFLNMPWNAESGDVWDTQLTSPSFTDGEWLADQYQKIRQALDNGEVVLESIKSSKKKSIKEEAGVSKADFIKAYIDAYGGTKKDAEEKWKSESDSYKKELVKGFKENAKKSFLNDSLKEGLNEDVDPDDDRAQGLAEYLGIDIEDVNKESYDDYGLPVYDTPEGTFVVGTYDECYDAAIEDVKSLIDDMGLESFSKDYQNYIMNNNDFVDTSFIMNALQDEIDYFEDEEDDEDTAERLNTMYEDAKRSGDYTEVIDYFRDMFGDEDFALWVGNNIYWDKVAEDVVDTDGIANSLARYDGEEHEFGNYYAYRIN